MLEDKVFFKSYMASLQELNAYNANAQDGGRLGEKLCFILRDFVAGLTDWKEEIKIGTSSAELYKRTWARCRNFILPMNPQRTELEYAVRAMLNSYGVKVHMPQTKTHLILPYEE